MESFDARDTHRRRVRRPLASAVETLESRALLAWSPLGFSLPDLTVQGLAAPVSSYNGPLTVTVEVSNLGASSIAEPFNQTPGAISSADAPPSQVGVFISRSPHFNAGVTKVGTVDVPAVAQNSVATVTSTLTMPSWSRRLPVNGGTLYVFFRADDGRQVVEQDETNNIARQGVPVRMAVGLPDLFAISMDAPPNLQPGDAIRPTIQLANYGTRNPSEQGPFEVDLVLSTDPYFGPGDTILHRFTVNSVPPLAEVPMQHSILGDVNIGQTANIISLTPPTTLTLPAVPARYFLGVMVDPTHQIREISEIGRPPSADLEPIRHVGPPIPGMPSGGVISPPAPDGNLFPTPPFGPIPSLLNPDFITITGITTPTATEASAPAGTLASVLRNKLAARRGTSQSS